jgi:hypothetical protein
LKVDGMTDVGRTTPPLPQPRMFRCEIQVVATTRWSSTREAVFLNTAEFTITVVHAVVSASPRARGELHGLHHAIRDETGSGQVRIKAALATHCRLTLSQTIRLSERLSICSDVALDSWHAKTFRLEDDFDGKKAPVTNQCAANARVCNPARCH